jgi:hypothetical protein
MAEITKLSIPRMGKKKGVWRGEERGVLGERTRRARRDSGDRKLIVVARYATGQARKDVRKLKLEEWQPVHHAYLLRLWQEPQDHFWRASLKTTAGEKEIAFASLDELFVYLLRQTEANERTNESDHVA